MGLYLGLISGTSMDAIDAAVVDFDDGPPRVLATGAGAFDPGLAARLGAMLDARGAVPLDEVGRLDVEIGRAFAQAALGVIQGAGIAPERIVAIGSHGQTLLHRVDSPVPFTWQIGDPNVIGELTGITVVADFRRRDVAAGGQGAPLVPVFHDGVFRSGAEDRAIVNIGGIANITVLTRSAPLSGFDTGPGNRLMDAWNLRHRRTAFDRDGRFADRADPEGLCRAAWLRPGILDLNRPHRYYIGGYADLRIRLLEVRARV